MLSWAEHEKSFIISGQGENCIMKRYYYIFRGGNYQLFYLPSEKGSTLIGKNLLTFSAEFGVVCRKQEVMKVFCLVYSGGKSCVSSGFARSSFLLTRAA